jgi:hypothetical protein
MGFSYMLWGFWGISDILFTSEEVWGLFDHLGDFFYILDLKTFGTFCIWWNLVNILYQEDTSFCEQLKILGTFCTQCTSSEASGQIFKELLRFKLCSNIE